MSSLANTTEKLRSTIKIGGIAIGSIFILYLFIIGGVFLKNMFFPTPPDAPEQLFGQLPEIIFEMNASAAINYQLNTISGELPTNLPNKMLVYKLDTPRPDLLALKSARSIASNSGFKNGETKISDNIYQWSNPSTNAVLQFNVNTKDFEIRSNFLTNQNIIANAVFPNEDRMKQYASDLLGLLRVNQEGLSYNERGAKYYTFSGNTPTQVDNLFNAKAVRLNLYNNDIQNELGTFSFVYPNPEFPLVTILAAFPSSTRMIVLESESYNKIITDESSDYPIKSPSEAFSDLEGGMGYLYNPNSLNTIQITEVYLAYYLDKNITEYAQPVYVFEAIDSRAYVPAIKYVPQLEESTSE